MSQAGGNRALVGEAAQHLLNAREAAAKAQADEALLSRLRAAEASMTSAETWAKRCEEGEAAVRRGKEALAAGDRDEAAGHCRAAQGLLNGGLKSETLRQAVQELEQALKAGKFPWQPKV